MKYESKKVILKNGKEALFRGTSAADAAEMLEYMKKTAEETEFLLRYPEECVMTVEREAAFLDAMAASHNDLMIACEVDGRIAGNCQISFNRKMKTAHRASVAIALLREFWGLGIGTLLFEELIAAAKERGILQIELEYIEGNERGKRLYEKMGFQTVAEKPNAIRLKDGTMLREICMVKYLG